MDDLIFAYEDYKNLGYEKLPTNMFVRYFTKAYAFANRITFERLEKFNVDLISEKILIKSCVGFVKLLSFFLFRKIYLKAIKPSRDLRMQNTAKALDIRQKSRKNQRLKTAHIISRLYIFQKSFYIGECDFLCTAVTIK